MNNVRAVAAAFRQAILDCPDNCLVTLRNFPNGACGDASQLLGEFLREHGYGEWEYVAGRRESDGHTHAWLECNGWILDITADYFPEIDEPVMLTQDETWHSQFLYEVLDRRSASVNMFDKRTNRNVAEVYAKIVAVYEQR